MDAVLAKMVQMIERCQNFMAWNPKSVAVVVEVDFDETVWHLTSYEDAKETVEILVFVPLQNTMMHQATHAIDIQTGSFLKYFYKYF